MLILGIETSCDETAAAIVKNGKTVLSSVVSSSEKLHQKYGGIVPEIAARKHAETIIPVIDLCLKNAGKKLQEIDYLAVSTTPGLIGGLLVGIEVTRSLSFALQKPIISINDLESHIYAAFLNKDIDEIKWPLLGLMVSGGTTALLFFKKSFGKFNIVGQTRDDSAGEVFDKVARLLDLGYPGGPAIQGLATLGDNKRYKLPYPLLRSKTNDFSFSGLKTAVLSIVKKENGIDEESLAASFQEVITEVLIQKTIKAALQFGAGTFAIGGGVAANTLLREKCGNYAGINNLDFFAPSIDFCTDNAAMVAGCAYIYAKNKIFSHWNELKPFEHKNLKNETCKY